VDRASPAPNTEITEFGANGPGVKFDALTMPAAE
jgi:hypothetical protein